MSDRSLAIAEFGEPFPHGGRMQSACGCFPVE